MHSRIDGALPAHVCRASFVGDLSGDYSKSPSWFGLRAEGIDTKIVEHYVRVMKNVTITMQEDVARWARVEAARRGISLSRMLGDVLRERMEFEGKYREHQAEFNAVEPRRLTESGQELPAREDLHERTGLR